MGENPQKNLKVPSRSNSTVSLIDKRNLNEVNDSDQGTLDDVSDQSFDDEVSEFDEITKERRVSFKVGAITADLEYFFFYILFSNSIFYSILHILKLFLLPRFFSTFYTLQTLFLSIGQSFFYEQELKKNLYFFLYSILFSKFAPLHL